MNILEQLRLIALVYVKFNMQCLQMRSEVGRYSACLHRPEWGEGWPAFVRRLPQIASLFMLNALCYRLGRKRISLDWINGPGLKNKRKEEVEVAERISLG